MQSLYRLKDMSPAHQELPQRHTRFSLNTKDRSAKSELSPSEELKKVSMRKSQQSTILESGILFYKTQITLNISIPCDYTYPILRLSNLQLPNWKCRSSVGFVELDFLRWPMMLVNFQTLPLKSNNHNMWSRHRFWQDYVFASDRPGLWLHRASALGLNLSILVDPLTPDHITNQLRCYFA